MAEPVLPQWATELRNRYLAGEASLFLLHGNVRDLHCWQDGDSKPKWLSLREFLESFLERTRDVVAYHNVSQGLSFAKKSQSQLFRSIVDSKRVARGDDKLARLPTTATAAIPAVEDLITDPTYSSAVIMDYFEMIAPNADVSFMVHEDKANLVSLMRWSTDPSFLATDNLVIIITESLSDISRRFVSSPQLATIQLSFPTLDERVQYIHAQDLAEVKMEMAPAVLGKMTAGLSLLQIRSLLRSAALSGDEITFGEVGRRKKTIIEQECHGLVEFIPPRHNFSHVGGMAGVKADLKKVADAVKEGNLNRVPMGMIFVGPMGTGKTFVAEAFATESGLTALKLKNFRDKYVGQTESNLERVLELVEALGYVLLIVDEADRGLAAGDSDGGVSSRVIARLKEFMSDTSHRGRVVMLMMTNRPDKLDVDLKRPGRFDMKIPFFFPETGEERVLIMQALVRKNKLVVQEDVNFEFASEKTEGFSGAELEQVLLAAGSLAGDADETCISQSHLDQAASDIIPSRDTRMLEFMEMLAVFECSAKRMLPDRFKELSTDDVIGRLDALRAQLGRRAL